MSSAFFRALAPNGDEALGRIIYRTQDPDACRRFVARLVVIRHMQAYRAQAYDQASSE